MDQENRFFTQAIVGTPRRLSLGVLSRLTQEPGFIFDGGGAKPGTNSPARFAGFQKWPLRNFSRWGVIAMVSLAGASIMWLLVVNRDASESGATMPTQYATKDAVAPAAYAPHVEPIPPLGKPPGSIVIEPTPFPVAAPDSPSPGDAKNGAETSTPRESPLPIAPAGSAQETSVLASTESQVKPGPGIIQKGRKKMPTKRTRTRHPKP